MSIAVNIEAIDLGRQVRRSDTIADPHPSQVGAVATEQHITRHSASWKYECGAFESTQVTSRIQLEAGVTAVSTTIADEHQVVMHGNRDRPRTAGRHRAVLNRPQRAVTAYLENRDLTAAGVSCQQ